MGGGGGGGLKTLSHTYIFIILKIMGRPRASPPLLCGPCKNALGVEKQRLNCRG